MSDVPRIDQSFTLSPSDSGAKRSIPKNIHIIIVGFIGLAIALMMISQTAKIEEKKEKKVEADQKDINREPLSIKSEPYMLNVIQESQEKTVIKDDPQPVLLPPVPQSSDTRNADGGSYKGMHPKDDAAAKNAADEARQRKQREEAIDSSKILAIRGGASGDSGSIRGVAAQISNGLIDPGAGPTERTAALKAEKAKALERMRSEQGGAMATLFGGANGQSIGSGTNSSGNVLKVEQPASKSVLMQGAVIPVVLVTALNSDLPGQIVAVTTSDVYDSISGRSLVIPRGSKFYGSYNADIKIGQERAMAAFQRVIRPDGSYVSLTDMPITDTAGQTGMEGDVNNHFFKMFAASFAIAGISHLFEKDSDQTVVVNGTQTTSMRDSTGKILGDISRQILQRNSRIPPTITVEAGEKFNVMVNKDIDIPPYTQKLPGQ